MEISSGGHKFFSTAGKNGEISFYPLETKRTIFFAKYVIGKFQISGGPTASSVRRP